MAEPIAPLDRAQLAAQVAAAPAGDLLPARLGTEEAHRPQRLVLVGAVDLPGADSVIAVMGAAHGSLVSGPIRVAGGTAHRATAGDGAASALAAALASGTPIEGAGFSSTLLTGPVGGVAPLEPAAPERPMLVDQTHESVVVGERAVVKWAVGAEPTPASVLVPHVAASGFTQMPRPWGFVTWADAAAPGSAPVLVASVMDYLPGASDGWTWAVRDVGQVATGGAQPETALAPMDAVGALVGDLHRALATPSSTLPEPRADAGAGEIGQWRELAEQLLAEALDAVDGPEGERLGERREAILDVLGTLDAVATTPTVPVHGDLHIGQVLRWDGGYAVGDFDGNPVLPVAERLRPQPAARDVAGMLASIDHVGRVVVRRVDGADPALVEQWIAEAQHRFLVAYRRRLAEHAASDLLDDRLLLPFRVEQECREFLYAVRHLPRWRYVPDQALQALIPTV